MNKYGSIKVGSKVRTTAVLMNGGSSIPVGSIGEVRHLYAGLEINFHNVCPHCKFGERITINRVPAYKVEEVKP